MKKSLVLAALVAAVLSVTGLYANFGESLGGSFFGSFFGSSLGNAASSGGNKTVVVERSSRSSNSLEDDVRYLLKKVSDLEDRIERLERRK